ncbi:MAG: chromate transporter [Chloroflexi bacterium]|nr:MAG: chromate transporter [Chloroflexota bacterium]
MQERQFKTAPVFFYRFILQLCIPRQDLEHLLQLFLIFLKVNLLSTSGPASVGLLYHEVVGKFVTEGQFVQAVGFSSVLPGSDALQLAMYIGYAVGGIPGGLVALLASILPPTVIILGVTMILHRLRREAWISSFVEGLTPAISVLMLFTAWKIFEKGGSDGWEAWAIGLVSMAGMLSKRVPERIVIVIAGLIGAFFL